MRPFKIGVQSSTLQCAANYAANGAEAKAVPRSFHADKELARRTRRTNVAQIVGQCRTHIFRQRQSLQSLTFAALPVRVVQGHSKHLATAQTESSQEQQDRVITLAGRCTAVAALKQSLDLFGRERLWQMRQPPASCRSASTARIRPPVLRRERPRRGCGGGRIAAA